MYYYQFNIGDYASSTQHLDELEDLAYRRMLDLYYSKEKPLPKEVKEIARLIRMRTHSESIANVLGDFFIEKKNGFHCMRADKEINAFKGKSDKARASAQARWNKNKDLGDSERNANALPTQSESNANHKPITNNHKPVKKTSRFTPPTLIESIDYFVSKGSNNFEADKFFNFYESKNWYVGKSKMKLWKSAANGWISRNKPSNPADNILEQSANSDWHLVEDKGF